MPKYIVNIEKLKKKLIKSIPSRKMQKFKKDNLRSKKDESKFSSHINFLKTLPLLGKVHH